MVETISRDELKAMMDREDDFFLVEALDERYYRRSHLPGAINLPPKALDRAEELLPDKEANIVVAPVPSPPRIRKARARSNVRPRGPRCRWSPARPGTRCTRWGTTRRIIFGEDGVGALHRRGHPQRQTYGILGCLLSGHELLPVCGAHKGRFYGRKGAQQHPYARINKAPLSHRSSRGNPARFCPSTLVRTYGGWVVERCIFRPSLVHA